MTIYIRPNGDDENDGSENAPGINRELGRAEEDDFPQGGG
jgi:hypothetical protein